MRQVQIKGYMKKDGNLMFYINDFKRNVSLAIGEKVSTSKLSKGQKSLLNSFFEVLEKCKAVCKYNLSENEEHKKYKNFFILAFLCFMQIYLRFATIGLRLALYCER